MSRAFSVPRASYILTPDDWEKILDAIANGHSLAGAARSVGATRQAVYARINSDPEFGEAIHQMATEGVDIVEDWMLEKAKRPTGFLANVAWLRAHRREKWGEDLPKQVAQPVINITIVAPSPIELRDIINSDYRVLSSASALDSVRIEAHATGKPADLTEDT